MITAFSASLRHAAVGVDEGGLRYGRWFVRLGGAERVPRRHAGIQEECIVLCTWEELVRSGQNSGAPES
jgi:hypothetical protein